MDKGMHEIGFLSLGKRHFCLSHISLLCAWKINHPVYIPIVLIGMTTPLSLLKIDFFRTNVFYS